MKAITSKQLERTLEKLEKSRLIIEDLSSDRSFHKKFEGIYPNEKLVWDLVEDETGDIREKDKEINPEEDLKMDFVMSVEFRTCYEPKIEINNLILRKKEDQVWLNPHQEAAIKTKIAEQMVLCI